MSLRPTTAPRVPDETARVARAAFPHGSLLLSLHDELGPVFEDRLFPNLFPRLGQPAETPWRLALVTLLPIAEAWVMEQRLRGRGHEQAMQAFRARLAERAGPGGPTGSVRMAGDPDVRLAS